MMKRATREKIQRFIACALIALAGFILGREVLSAHQMAAYYLEEARMLENQIAPMR